MQRYTIQIGPAEGDGPVIAWTLQAADEQAAQEMAEAEYRRAHPEVASITIERISHRSG
jgi:hypothetical protein